MHRQPTILNVPFHVMAQTGYEFHLPHFIQDIYFRILVFLSFQQQLALNNFIIETRSEPFRVAVALRILDGDFLWVI